MPSHIQGRGLSVTESSATSRKVASASLNCVDSTHGTEHVTADIVASPVIRWSSKLNECPMCGRPPVEPIRVEGVFACRACTGGCNICGSSCIHGDEVCGECVRVFGVGPWAVPA